jgi:hypothetical protein
MKPFSLSTKLLHKKLVFILYKFLKVGLMFGGKTRCLALQKGTLLVQALAGCNCYESFLFINKTIT